MKKISPKDAERTTALLDRLLHLKPAERVSLSAMVVVGLATHVEADLVSYLMPAGILILWAAISTLKEKPQ